MNYSFIQKTGLISLLFLASFAAHCQSKVEQLSDDQVEAFYRRAQSSGMSEMQIEQAAMAQGFTLSDIALMRQRISKVQKSGTKNGKDVEVLDSVVSPRRQMGTVLSVKSEVPKNRSKADTSKIFGANLFNTPSLSFEPNLRIATPKNYQLGPDDELIIEIFGNASGTYRVKVSPEGMVKIPDLAPVYVSGLTIEDAKEKIVARLRQIYAGLNAGGSSATINLGNIRSIKVTVTGEAARPGTYTVSSLATAFNALYLCGGPNDNGTYRNIRVIRNNKLVRTIDIYDFLLRADQANNIILQDQDIIHIPFYSTRVALHGEVKRPAIYETTENEVLQSILTTAGGYTGNAYRTFLTLRRTTDKDRQIVNVSQADFATFKPQDGDIYTVSKVLERFQNRVQVAGAVFRPGEYALGDKLLTLTQLIEKAEGLREDAFKKRAMIHREKQNLDPELLAVDLEKLLTGEIPDVVLKRQDSVVIRSIKELHEAYFVTIVGEINRPGDAQFEQSMTVSDLVAQAGGFTEGAIGSRIEIARRIKEDNAMVNENYSIQIIPLKIDRMLSLNANDALFVLQPFDIVYVRKSPRYELQRGAIIAGAVAYPGSYAIVNNQERINSLLERAGGIKPSGYLPGVVLRRNGERIAIDVKPILENPTVEGNILLENGDSLFVPERSEVVRISGAVLNPSIVNYSKQFEFQEYISQAGGYGERARKRSVYVTYANGYTDRTRKFLFFNIYPKIAPGSTINVPFKPDNTNKSDLTAPLLLSFFSTILIAFATILR